MADYREKSADGTPLDNPHSAHVSSSSTGVHTIKAVTTSASGESTVHNMGEYLDYDEAKGKVDEFNKTRVTELPDARPAEKPVLTAKQNDEHLQSIREHIRVNPNDTSMKQMYPEIYKAIHGNQ